MNANDFKEQLPFYREGLHKGLEQGLERGLVRGREQGLRASVSDLCEVLAIALTEPRRVQLAALELAGLEALRRHLVQHRAWPD